MDEERPKARAVPSGGGGPAAANAAGQTGAPRDDDSEGAPPAEQKPLHYYLGFHLGEEIFALPLEQLREVVPLTAITRVPGSPAKVAGLVNLRGQIVCAFHARACLQLQSTAPSQEPIVLVLQGFDEPLGLIVDSIVDVYAVDPDRIESRGGAERAPYLSGTVAVGGAVLGLLDLDRVILS